MFDDRALRIFSVLSEEGNFTRAARRLGISQPAVSQSILELEKQLGTKLFDRTRTAATLTPEGETFRSYASEILKWYDAAGTLFSMAGKATLRRPLGVSCPVMAAESIVPELLRDCLAITADTFSLHLTDDEAAGTEDDIVLYSTPRKETLDFEEGATWAGVLTAVQAGKADDDGSVALAIWSPYEKTLDKDKLTRVTFSSPSTDAVLRMAERIPGMIAIVPHIAARGASLPVLPGSLPRLQRDLHLRFGPRIESTSLSGILRRKLAAMLV